MIIEKVKKVCGACGLNLVMPLDEDAPYEAKVEALKFLSWKLEHRNHLEELIRERKKTINLYTNE